MNRTSLKAPEAEHDILLKFKDSIATIEVVADVVKQDRINEDQINHSIYKLLYQKIMLGLHDNRVVGEDRIGQSVGTMAHRVVMQKAVDQSVTLFHNEVVFPLKEWKLWRTAHIIIQKDDNHYAVWKLIQKMTSAFQGIISYSLKPDMSETSYVSVNKDAEQAELVILSFFVQLARFGEGGWYGNQSAYFYSFIKIMKRELIPSGKLSLIIRGGYLISFALTN